MTARAARKPAPPAETPPPFVFDLARALARMLAANEDRDSSPPAETTHDRR